MMLKKVTKATGVMMIIMILFIVIPACFALNENETLSVSMNGDVNDDVPLAGDYGEYYFDSSNSKAGDGSIDNPYRKLTYDRIEDYSTLHFAEGNYSFNFDDDRYAFVSDVTFVGENPKKTIISYDGDNTCGEFVARTGDSLTLVNLTFVGFNFYTAGGNIYAENCIFKDTISPSLDSEGTDLVNSAKNSFGGVITAYMGEDEYYYYYPDVGIENCTFINNTAEYGGSIFIQLGYLTVTNSLFYDNYAYNYGGALAALYDTDVMIENTTFLNDRSINDAGGAIYLLTSPLISCNMTITNCSSTFGGAITSLNSPLEISLLNAVNNTARYEGGAIYQMYNDISVTDSTFTGNTARNGGAVFVDDVGAFELRGNYFDSNTAYLMGGAVYSLLAHDPNISGNSYSRNRAGKSNDLYQTDKVNMNIGSGNYTMVYSGYTYDGELPSQYSLVSEKLVTPVKDQEGGGNCWAFGSIAALESAILKATGQSIILSEENMKNLAELFSDYGWNAETNGGGIDEMAIGYLVSWLGPVLLSQDEDDDYSMLSPVLNSFTHVQNVKYVYRDSYTDNDAIKRAVMSYGAVASGIYMDEELYFNNRTNAYYCPGEDGSNHEIVIVGWDDSYSRNNFKKKPSADGAWICKNSWNTDWGSNGYFYVSYYDSVVAQVGNVESCYVFVFNDPERYERNYQYDIIGKTDYFTKHDDTIWVENIFEAEGDESLAAVSTYFRKTTDYVLYIYVNDELELTRSGTCMPGYTTINLGQYVPLSSGDKFKVRFKLTADEAEFAVSYGSEANKIFQVPGTSFFSEDGKTWEDLYYYYEDYDGDVTVACIKAFTVSNRTPEEVHPSIQLDVSTSYNNALIIVKIVDELTGQTLYYNGNVSINIAGVDYTTSLIDGVAVRTHKFSDVGEYTITARYDDYTAKTKVTVSNIQLTFKPVINIEENDVEINIESMPAVNTTLNVYVDGDGYRVSIARGKGVLPLQNLEEGYYEVFASVDDSVYVGNFTTSFYIYDEGEELEDGTFNDLQNIIDDASDSSVITLYRDFYYDYDIDYANLESGLDIDKNIIINGNGHTIYGNGARIMWIYSDVTAIIYNLTFANIFDDELILGDEDYSGYSNGGAIYNNGLLYLDSCNFYFNLAFECGGAIYASSKSSTIISDCFFINNTVVYNDNSFAGGAIYSAGELYVADSGFLNNYADFGGAIATFNEAYIDGSVFLNNNAYTTGGAIFNYADNLCYASDCYFDGNEAEYGGAINNVTAIDCYFEDTNYASEGEGHDMRYGININSTTADDYPSNFYKTIKSTGFEFNPATLVYTSGTYNKNFDVIVTSNPNGEKIYGVNVVLSIDDTINYTVSTDKNGLASFTLPDLSNGLHKFTVCFEYQKFNDAVIDYSVVVGKADSKITYSNPISFDYGSSGYTTLTLDGCTVSDYYIVSHPAAQVLLNGNRITVSGLDAGSYTLHVNGAPLDERYSPSQVDIPVTVNKVASTLTLNPNSIAFDYGSSGSTAFTVDGGTVSADVVGSTSAQVQISANRITVSGLDAGSYSLHVSVNPDANHESAEATIPVTVNRVASTLTLNPNSIVFDYGSSGSATFTTNAGSVTASVVNNPTASVQVSGSRITVSGLDAGSYTLHVETASDANHDGAEANIPITVNRIASTATFSPASITFDYGGSASTAAALNGCTISGAGIANNPGSVQVNGNQITVSGLDAGSYTIQVSFTPDANHVSTDASIPVTVNRINAQITAKDFSTISNSGEAWSVKLSDANGNAISGRDITLDVASGSSNAVYTIRTDANGIAKFFQASSLSVGSHRVTLSVSDKNINCNPATSTITVASIPSVVVESTGGNIGEAMKLQARVFNSNNAAVNEGKVLFYDGNTNIGQADVVNGVATLTYTPAASGEHAITAVYETGAFRSSNSTAAVKVTEKPQINVPSLDSPSADGTVAVTLPADATGTVTLSVNGIDYPFAVSNGVANVKLPELPNGDYQYTLSYSGDGKYGVFTTQGTFKAAQVDPVIVASDMTVTYDTGGRYTVLVYGTNGKAAAGADVSVSIDGVPFANLKTDSNGFASFEVTQKPGTYTVTLISLNKIETRTLTVNHLITLKKVTVKRSAKKLVLKATLGKAVKGEKIKFKFNGKKYTAKTNSKGVAKVTIKSNVLKKLKAGKKITYQATYKLDKAKIKVKVKK